jgi:DNA polymerase V
MTDKTKHGGQRTGAGRKTAYGEPTKQVRIPESQVPVVLDYLSALRRQQHIIPQNNEGRISSVRSLHMETPRWAIPVMSHTIPAGFPSPA